MAGLYNKYRDKGFTVVAVNAWDDEDAKTVKRFARKNKLGYPILLGGGSAASNWGVRAIPENFLIDQNGKLVKKIGEITKSSLPKVEKSIESLLAKRP